MLDSTMPSHRAHQHYDNGMSVADGLDDGWLPSDRRREDKLALSRHRSSAHGWQCSCFPPG